MDNGGYGDLNTILKYVSDAPSLEVFEKWYRGGTNYVTYEGTFHKARRRGPATLFSRRWEIPSATARIPRPVMGQGLACWIDTGEFKDDEPDGKVCQYCAGSLYYDRE